MRLAGRTRATNQKPSPDWDLLHYGSLHAVVDAIAHIHVKMTWRPKQRFVLGGAAAISMASGFVLGIGLRFNNHTPKQAESAIAIAKEAGFSLTSEELVSLGEEFPLSNEELESVSGGTKSPILRTAFRIGESTLESALGGGGDGGSSQQSGGIFGGIF